MVSSVPRRRPSIAPAAADRRRVALAKALVQKPDLLLLDEPTNHLDIATIRWLEDRVHSYPGAVIFITHDLSIEAEVSDRIMVMYAGRAVEIGTNEQIYGPQGPSHPYTQRLLGATPRLHEEVKELSFIPGTPPDPVRLHRAPDEPGGLVPL